MLTRVAHSSADAQHMRRSSTYSTSRPTIQDPTVMSSLAYLYSMHCKHRKIHGNRGIGIWFKLTLKYHIRWKFNMVLAQVER